MLPVIGLLGDVDNEGKTSVKNTYVHAFEACGAISVALPYSTNKKAIAELVDLCDGFCFTGGVDVSPVRYGEEVLDCCGEIKPLRDEFEFVAFDSIFMAKKPIIAICRGIQLVNVAMGGTLFQDIATQLNSPVVHSQSGSKLDFCHTVQLRTGTPLFNLLKRENILVNSFHHQAVKDLALGLKIMAECDGIVEAVYSEGENYIRGYQWHPELLVDSDEISKMIFEEFVSECKRNMR